MYFIHYSLMCLKNKIANQNLTKFQYKALVYSQLVIKKQIIQTKFPINKANLPWHLFCFKRKYEFQQLYHKSPGSNSEGF